MKVTAKTDIYVSSPWGAAIIVRAGEVKEVGDDFGYLCLQAGCTEAKDKPKPEPPPKEKTSAKEAEKS